MANSKSAEKRHRQSLKRRQRNRHYKSTMRTYIKRARKAIAEHPAQADEAVRKATAFVARVASKGIIHRNTAARTISRLTRALQRARQG